MRSRLLSAGALVALSSLSLSACSSCSEEAATDPPATPPTGASATEAEAPPPPIDRLRFNQLAMRLDVPLFWTADTDSDGAPDPSEIRSLLFYPTEARWVDDAGQFTPEYDAAVARIRAELEETAPTDPRVTLVHAELDRVAPTLVANDLRELPDAHREFARHMVRVGALIDTLYARQTGMTALEPQSRQADVASRSMFRRNWGPRCRGATTE
nr:hypothetical protein [Myxococcota bacterium]